MVALTFGTGDLRFELVTDWQKRPSGWPLEDIASVATDSEDNVYLYARGEHPVSVYDRAGRFLGSWGEGRFSSRSHGMFITPVDDLLLVDDGMNQVARFTLDGVFQQAFGPIGVRSDSGYRDGDPSSIVRAAGPYNSPTNVTVSELGDVYVSDGYRNASVHQFTPAGELVRTWGGPGSGPGEFRTPHGIAVDGAGRVFVADRENDRVQVFSGDGVFLQEWTDVQRPQDIFIDSSGHVFVAELSWFSGERSFRNGPVDEYLPARLSIFDLDGELLTRWSDPDPTKDGFFVAPHGIWVDSEGSVYLAEVPDIWAVQPGYAPPTVHRFQKFARL